MRTQEEIVLRIKEREASDFFGFEVGDLISCLTFEYAQPWLKETAKADEWKQESAEDADVLARLKDYMKFAWDKANNCRGLSAGRSLNHMEAWLWLLGEKDAADALDEYDRYGKPQLAAICEHYGIDWKEFDDGNWVNEEDGPHLGVEVAKLPFSSDALRGND